MYLSPTGSAFLTKIQTLLLKVVLEKQNLKAELFELVLGNPWNDIAKELLKLLPLDAINQKPLPEIY